jgi:hypothetical protein
MLVRSRKNIAVTPAYRSADSWTTIETTLMTMPRTPATIAPSELTASVMWSWSKKKYLRAESAEPALAGPPVT